MRVEIVCLGDSIVYGYGAPAKGSWPELAAKRLKINILNQGINGNTTDEMLARFSSDVIAFKPEKVAILGGANDILLGMPVKHTCESIEMMIAQARKHHIIPLLCTPAGIDGELLEKFWFSCCSMEETNNRFKEYIDWLIAFSEVENIAVVDFSSEYVKRMKKTGTRHYYVDGVHPTREGYRILADIFCDAYSRTI